MSIRIGNKIVAGMPEKALHGIGEIFTTTDTGVIAGAVEANGGSYNIADYNSGKDSVAFKLAAGTLSYVSKAEFQTQVANTGACDSFGWNGGGGTFYGLQNKRLETDRVWTKNAVPTVGDLVYDEGGAVIPNTTVTSVNGGDISVTQTWDGGDATKTYNANAGLNFTQEGDPTFLVPKLNPWHIGKNAPVVGNGMTLGLTDGTNNAGLANVGGVGLSSRINAYGSAAGKQNSGNSLDTTVSWGITTDPTKSGMIADLSETTGLRVMVQLATGATDQALETCTSVLSDVSALKEHRVIEFQAPTAANSYTWYRKYADGWVEQGGVIDTPTGDTTYSVTMPVEMADANYFPQLTSSTGNIHANMVSLYTGTAPTTIVFWFRLTHKYNSASTPTKTGWQVSGIAAQ